MPPTSHSNYPSVCILHKRLVHVAQFPKHEAARSISIRPGWDASPSQGYPLQ